MTFALNGIRILDSAHQYPGPYCSMLLGDLGAEIIKVERPVVGDPARFWPGFFGSINRNKKSITLDLKKSDAKDILYRLVERSDVFTEGFRPGVASRIGIDYDTLKEINPRLIYCSISGYGQDGPYRDLPGHDINYMALAGMLQEFKDRAGNITLPTIAIGDLSSGMFAVIGILAALMAREKSGKGQYVDVSMFDGLVSWMSTRIGSFFANAPSEGEYDVGYGIFNASDGKAFTLGVAHENWFWDRLCSAIGLDELQGLGQPERKNQREALVEKLRTAFSQRPRDEWMKILVQADVPVAPVHTMEDVVKDPHVIFREIIQDISLRSGETNKQVNFPVKLLETPGKIRLPPPALGEHNEEILHWLEYTTGEIEVFKNKGVI
jgi:crotonobetainyl-CoA:carnitine CoA-transferase CaiB-like acyl-CoA transferase